MGGKKQRAAAPPAPSGATNVLWHTLPVADVYNHAKTTLNGLTDADVSARKASYGPNRMTAAKKAGFFERLWNQINNVLIWILLAAACVSGGFQDWKDFGLILAVVVLNVIIGMIQEGKAEKAAEAIKAMLAPTAIVTRNGGKRTQVDAVDVVPGDIVFLQSGDRIPADVRFVSITNLQVMEAVLTGESAPVLKSVDPAESDAPLGDRHCMGFSGTMVVYGQGIGVVTSTGDYAEIGKINALVADTDGGDTPLMLQLEVFGRWVALFTLVVALTAFLVALLARKEKASDAFATAISIAVAIIPEGLPSVVTISLALGVQHMAKNQAIIRKLPAVETLGAVTVICTDKTGTLTRNEMTAVNVKTTSTTYRVTGGGYSPDGELKLEEMTVTGTEKDKLARLVLAGVLCNDAGIECKIPKAAAPAPATRRGSVRLEEAKGPAPGAPKSIAQQSVRKMMDSKRMKPVWGITGDPTEGALLTLGLKAGCAHNDSHLVEIQKQHPRIATIPFESDYKFMATMHDIPSLDGKTTKRTVFIKGAWDRLIDRSATQAIDNDTDRSEPINRDMWLKSAQAFAKEGLRVLAFAQFVVPNDSTSLLLADILEGEPRLQMNCLVAIVDPPRTECVTAVSECHGAGITVKMITGDHPDTAATIGGWLGIESDEVLTGQRMEEMTDEELEKHVEGCNIYARASPEHKLRIVRALQKHGHVCAMTGDGVNDAPALKQASIGVAMGITGTEVAKEASKMILANDAFDTIVKAVKEGRTVYDNLLKVIMFSLPTNFAQGFCLFFTKVIGLVDALAPIQILYVNMVTSVTSGIVLALEEAEDGIMQRKPRRPGKPIMGKYILWRTFWVTSVLCVFMIGNMQWHLRLNGYDKDTTDRTGIRSAQTVAMNTLVIAQCFYAFNCRFYKGSSVKLSTIYSNPLLLGAIMLNAALQAFLTYTPGVQDAWELWYIDGIAWLRILMFAAALFVMVEIEKALCPYFGPSFTRAVKRLACKISCKGSVARHALPMSGSSAGIPTGSSSRKTIGHNAQLDTEVAKNFGSRRNLTKDGLGVPAAGASKQPLNVSKRRLSIPAAPRANGTGIHVDAVSVNVAN